MPRIIFLVILFFTFSLYGADIFSEFDNKFTKSNKQEQIKIHKELKDNYVKAIIQNDISKQKQSLLRLIQSAKILKLNHEGYEKDLEKINKKSINNQKEYNKNQVKDQKIIKKPLYLLSATKKDSFLELKFNQNIENLQFKNFLLSSGKQQRSVLDIPAILNGKSITYNNFLNSDIRIAQFDKSIIRIVFSATKAKQLYTSANGQFLYISTSQKNNYKSKSAITKNQQKSFITIPKPLIVIDPGHGGKDPGAIGIDKKQEKTAVLAVGKKLGKLLIKRGYKVDYTRDKDKFINLRDRTKIANEKSADLFISIHANAAPNTKKSKSMHGIETFFLSPARSERSKNAAALENRSDIEEMNFFSQQTFLNFLNREKIIASNKLGIDVHNQLLKSIKTKHNVTDGGVREAPFWVLVGALMPAVLIEIGYITHPVEGRLLFDDKYQELLANGIANGIDEYFKKNR